jgi:hypothetical protein
MINKNNINGNYVAVLQNNKKTINHSNIKVEKI